MLVVFINLDRAPQRRDFMTRQFEALGLEAERLPAVDGSKLDLTPYQSNELTPGEIGCFLSHRAAWESIVASGEEHGLILEDDVRLSERLPALLHDPAWLKGENRIVKLDTSGKTVTLDAKGQPLPGAAAYRLRGEHSGAAGYIVSRAAAADLLARTLTFTQPVDLFLFDQAAVSDPANHIVQIVPAMVSQEKCFGDVSLKGMQSTIRVAAGSKRASAITRVAKELRRGIRKLRRAVNHLPSKIKGTRRYMRVPFA